VPRSLGARSCCGCNLASPPLVTNRVVMSVVETSYSRTRAWCWIDVSIVDGSFCCM